MEKKNDEIIREDHIKGHLDSIDFETMKIIDEQAKHNIFRIDKTKSVGTGFFCLIPFPDQTNRLPVLATCHHVLNKDDIAIGNQICLIFKDGEKKFLKIDKDRKTYTSDEKKYDTTFIEIKKDDGFDINEMIEIDKNLYKENLSEIYAKSSIYITHYPNGKEIKLSFEILQNITEDNYRIFHFCSTKEGSSGSPILNLKNYNVIGIHTGKHKLHNYNIGTLIKGPILEFNEFETNKNNDNQLKNININEDIQNMGNKLKNIKLYNNDNIKAYNNDNKKEKILKNEIICIYNKQKDVIDLLHDYHFGTNGWSDEEKESYIEGKNNINGNNIDIYI